MPEPTHADPGSAALAELADIRAALAEHRQDDEPLAATVARLTRAVEPSGPPRAGTDAASLAEAWRVVGEHGLMLAAAIIQPLLVHIHGPNETVVDALRRALRAALVSPETAGTALARAKANAEAMIARLEEDRDELARLVAGYESGAAERAVREALGAREGESTLDAAASLAADVAGAKAALAVSSGDRDRPLTYLARCRAEERDKAIAERDHYKGLVGATRLALGRLHAGDESRLPDDARAAFDAVQVLEKHQDDLLAQSMAMGRASKAAREAVRKHGLSVAACDATLDGWLAEIRSTFVALGHRVFWLTLEHKAFGRVQAQVKRWNKSYIPSTGTATVEVTLEAAGIDLQPGARWWRVRYIDERWRRCTAFVEAKDAPAAAEASLAKGADRTSIYAVEQIDAKTGQRIDYAVRCPGEPGAIFEAVGRVLGGVDPAVPGGDETHVALVSKDGVQIGEIVPVPGTTFDFVAAKPDAPPTSARDVAGSSELPGMMVATPECDSARLIRQALRLAGYVEGSLVLHLKPDGGFWLQRGGEDLEKLARLINRDRGLGVDFESPGAIAEVLVRLSGRLSAEKDAASDARLAEVRSAVESVEAHIAEAHTDAWDHACTLAAAALRAERDEWRAIRKRHEGAEGDDAVTFAVAYGHAAAIVERMIGKHDSATPGEDARREAAPLTTWIAVRSTRALAGRTAPTAKLGAPPETTKPAGAPTPPTGGLEVLEQLAQAARVEDVALTRNRHGWSLRFGERCLIGNCQDAGEFLGRASESVRAELRGQREELEARLGALSAVVAPPEPPPPCP